MGVGEKTAAVGETEQPVLVPEPQQREKGEGETEKVSVADDVRAVSDSDERDPEERKALERRLRFKIDLRLCTIAGLLCSLNLLDSGVISSASVTSMVTDLGLFGNRYSVSIFIFTIASIVFQ